MSDKNFKVKNGIDANGTITVNSVGYGKALVVYGNGGGTIATFYRDGVEYGSISDWANYKGTGINIMGDWTSRSPGIDSQSFFNVGYDARSAAGFMGTASGTNPVVYISTVGSATNDLLQLITPTNSILAKFDYLGSFYNSGLIEAGRTKTSDGASAFNFITVGSYSGSGGQATINRGSGYNGNFVLTNYGNGSIILNQGGTNILTITNTGAATFSSDLTVTGNFTVNGTTTNINSTSLIVEDKNIVLADVATPTDTTADGAGITIKGATDKTLNWVQSTGAFTSSDPFIINNTSTTTVPLTVKGYASQTSNHFEVQDSSSLSLFKVIPPAGTRNENQDIYVRPGGTGGVAQVGNSSFAFALVTGALGSVYIGVPGGASALQVVVDNTFNRYKIIGKGTGVAPIFTTDGNDTDVNMHIYPKGAGKIGINKTSPTGYVHIQTPSATVVPLTVQATDSQTYNLQEWQLSNGFQMLRILSSGSMLLGNTNVDSNNYLSFIKAGGASGGNAGIRFGNDADGSNQQTLTVNTGNAHLILEHKNASGAFIIKGASSQTANIQEWQDSTGTAQTAISSLGRIISAQRMSIGSSVTSPLLVANINFTTGASDRIGLLVRGYASQTADLQQWQDSTGTVLNTITSSGTLVIGGTTSVNPGFGITMVNKALANYYTGNNSSYVPALAFTRGNTTGTWMNFGTVGDSSNGVASIDIRDGGNGQLFSVGYTGNTSIILNSPSNVALTIKSAASQTADLQQWKNAGDTVLAKVDASGNITDASNTKWLSPIGSGSDDAPTIQALIDGGKKEIRLGSGQWTFSTRIKVPNGVTIRGIGTSTTSTTGTRVNAVALIASEGTVRDITFTGAGENSQSEVGGGIAVLGGRVIDCSVTDSRYVLAPTRQPHGYLKNFMSKMQGSYGSVRVAILGDSLSENTSTTSWYGYLFNSSTSATGYYLGSYFAHPIAPSEVDNMAIGGQGAYLLSAQLAMTKDTLRTGGYVNQVLDGDNVSTSPFFNRNYNLAIIAIGQNGGTDWKAHLEYVVKTIRDKGIDVILLTQNPAAGNPTSRAGDEYYYRSMAETYGCLLIDTQAYYRLEVEFGRALGTTADLFGDGIHQSTLGHQLYAKAILNGILDYDSTITVPANKTVVSRSYIPAETTRATVIAGMNAYYLVKNPDSVRDISGVTYTTATDSSIKNPIYGRGTTTNSVATLASGGYATWGVEYANAAYIIYRENSTSNTLTVSLQGGGSTLATLTTGVTNGRTSVQKVTLSGGTAANRAIRITNTSGDPVQIYGVVFETHADVAFNRNLDGSYPGVKLNGTWSYGDFLGIASYGGFATPYTSTTNAYATFKFYGDGLRFATSYGKNSGIIQVKIDDTTYTAVDTYSNINEYGVYTHFYGGLQYGLHTATITLTGANASVTGNNSDGARFGLHRISAVRSSWYLTQDQQLAPNSDISAKINSLSSPTVGSVGSANIMNFWNGTNGYGAGAIAYNGTFNINGANIGFPYTSSGATVNVNAGSASIIPLTVRGAASQTADLQEWQNSSGTAIVEISPTGTIKTKPVGFSGNLNTAIISVTDTASTWGEGNFAFRSDSGGIPRFSFTAPNAASELLTLRGNSVGVLTSSPGSAFQVTADTSSTIGIIVKAAASQTADLQQWQDSSGTVAAKIASNGYITAGIIYANSNFYSGYQIIGGRANVLLDGSAAMGMVNWNVGLNTLQLRNVASQTADSLKIENSSGTAIARIDASGNLFAVSKSFDIEHPTKENMRLRYASLEGPENGVYVRGTATTNVIELPDYWTGLVHEDSITVSLTSVGSAQNIYVEKIEDNKVYIGGNLEKAFFTVYGERKDIDKLTVEY